MFESLRYHLGGGIDPDYIDQEHAVVNNMIKDKARVIFLVDQCGTVSFIEQNVNHLSIKGTYFDYCA
jgi:hypothetical protein